MEIMIEEIAEANERQVSDLSQETCQIKPRKLRLLVANDDRF